MDFGSLLFAGFWDRRLGVLGATGLDPDFHRRMVVLLAVSLYLLKQDLVRVEQQ